MKTPQRSVQLPEAFSYALFALAPIFFVQGKYVRHRTPRLPEASGPDSGLAKVTGSSDGQPFHLLVLGESTVAGVGASTHEQAITGQLAHALSEKLQRPIHWRALGRNGVTARRVRTELLPLFSPQQMDLAVIALGVNDTLKLHRRAQWTRDLRELIAAVRQSCAERGQVSSLPVIIAGVPPMQHFPALPQPLSGFLGWRSQLLDEAAAKLAMQLELAEHAPMKFEGGREFFCEDGFHPSVIGYKMWATHLAVTAMKLLPAHKTGQVSQSSSARENKSRICSVSSHIE